MTDVKIVAIVGSLRTGSVNGAVARAAMASTDDGVDIELFDLADVPLYNGDIEEAGLPVAVEAFHDAVEAADGLMIFSPEYNGSFPAVTKNAIDWLSRPPRSWEGTAVSLVVITPGPRAGLSLRTHCDALLEFQPVRAFASHGIGTYGDKLTEGELSDQATLSELAAHVAAFATFCATTD